MLAQMQLRFTRMMIHSPLPSLEALTILLTSALDMGATTNSVCGSFDWKMNLFSIKHFQWMRPSPHSQKLEHSRGYFIHCPLMPSISVRSQWHL